MRIKLINQYWIVFVKIKIILSKLPRAICNQINGGLRKLYHIVFVYDYIDKTLHTINKAFYIPDVTGLIIDSYLEEFYFDIEFTCWIPSYRIPKHRIITSPSFSDYQLSPSRSTLPNFDHWLASTTSIHFIPSKFDHWYKMYGGGRI